MSAAECGPRIIRQDRDDYAAEHPADKRPSRFAEDGTIYAAWAARADAWADDRAEQAERTERPWERYQAHAARYAATRRAEAHMSQEGFIRATLAWGGTITEPHHTNPMQSAPHVLFSRYELEPTAEHPHGHIVATWCEGDVSVERYATRAHANRALWLLARAL